MPGIVRLRPGSVRRRLPLAYTLSIQLPSWPTWWPMTFAFDSDSGGRAGCTRDLGTTSGVLFGTLFRPGQLAGAGSSVGCKFGRWLAAATTCRAANRFTSSWVTMNVPGHWSTRIIEVRCGGGPWFGPCGNDRRTRTPSSSSGCDTAPHVGVVAPIHSGGLLPLISESPELVLDSLFELAACECNELAST